MSCIDQAAVRRAFGGGEPDLGAWGRHLEICVSCRAGLAPDRDDSDEHPQALMLVRFDEEPENLDPEVRAWIGRHLEQCPPCRDSISEVPALSLPSARSGFARGRRFMPAAAAAGWIAAVLLGAHALTGSHAPVGRPEEERRFVLSAQRDGVAPAVPPGATILLLSLVLADDVSAGERLEVRVRDAAGVLSAPRSIVVEALDDWGRPVLRFNGAELPFGRIHLEIRTPRGHEAAYVLDHQSN